MGVEFNENKPTNYGYEPSTGGITGFIIKNGLAKNEAGAQKVLIGIAVICFALAIYLFIK